MFAFILLFFSGCQEAEEATLFTLLNEEETGIKFLNDLPYTEAFNTYTYRNFYNGGGVALGDINNDGLIDIYFTGNIVDSKLYLNKGNWKFEDISESSGVACPNIWSTGASMVDINGDGLLDIYVCKAGKPGGKNRHNELFINNGDLTFSEESKAYGLDILGLSIHSAFFDFDKDGDLDCYILNNSIRSVGGFDFKEGLREIPDPEGNKFLINENGKFREATTEVGMYSSNIGYGLGITLSDVNGDDWTDIFISNDFFERDYLYINNQDGTFTESSTTSMGSLSMGSMGADAADINNDLLPDLFVTEMLPTTLARKKTKAQYEDWNKHTLSKKYGYHNQYTRNVLQQNLGKGKFIEIGRAAGVADTEWSWASLIQDFDNDGLKDLFVSNGIYKDLLDKDYLNYFANDNIVQSKIAQKQNVLLPLIDSMTSHAIPNVAFKNMGGMNFQRSNKTWGLETPTFSNGSAYGDLDNDGDLDLVVNNVNMPSMVYRNNGDINNNFIQYELQCEGLNSECIGAKIEIYYDGHKSMLEKYTSKGFQSTVDGKLHFGIGSQSSVDSTIITWPSGKKSLLEDLKANSSNRLKEREQIFINYEKEDIIPENAAYNIIDYEHMASNKNLFNRERLLIEMNGFSGPSLSTGDLNGDAIDDVFIGGTMGQNNITYLSTSKSYTISNNNNSKQAKSDVVTTHLFDSDNDGDLDIYLGHGGKSFSKFSPELNDIIYINDGSGIFSELEPPLPFPRPIHTGAVITHDIDNDGYQDLIVAEKMNNTTFGLPGSIFIFKNNGSNKFSFLSEIANVGMISDMTILDIDRDEKEDIVALGKWMPITKISSHNGLFSDAVIEPLPNTEGLWNTIHSVDIDNDGALDLICGNEGINNFYEKGMVMYINDFDQNGSMEQIVTKKIDGKLYPLHDIDELYSQLPILKKKYKYYNEIAEASMTDLFDQNLIESSIKLSLNELHTVAIIIENKTWKILELPQPIQYSSVYAIHSTDDNIYLGGNNYRVKPQFGRQDASYGWVMKKTNSSNFGKIKSLHIDGQIRDIATLNDHLLFSINGESIKSLKIDNE